MIGDTVAIEVPETVSERNLARALGACEAALGVDQCTGAGLASGTDFRAEVSQTSVSELSIELVLNGGESPVVVRVLSFESDEPEAFRWQSVGVVVAALVLSQQTPKEADDSSLDPSSESASPPQLPTAKPALLVPEQPTPLARPGPSRPPNPGPPSRAFSPTLDLAGLLSSPVSGAAVGAGGWLNVAVPIGGPLLLSTQADSSWSRSSTAEVALRGLALGASFGVVGRFGLGHPRWFWEASARAAFQGLRVLGEAGASRETAWIARWGGRGGAALAWFPGDDWGVVLGADGGILWPPLEVTIAGEEPTAVSPFVWGGYLGLRVRIRPL